MTAKRPIPISYLIFFTTIAAVLNTPFPGLCQSKSGNDSNFISYTVNPTKQDVQLSWKDSDNNRLQNFGNLKLWLNKNKRQLLFAMNGGMYKQDGSPLGLYIENKIIQSPLNTQSGDGNFYLEPNGVFYITTNNVAGVCTTPLFKNNGNIKFATQSGPMLLVDGKIHAAFKQGSSKVHIRNGVGILPNNEIVFAMSKKEINLYDFAGYFKALGCTNALYLDGFVSRAYLPEKNWLQTDGDFGVLIGVSTNLR